MCRMAESRGDYVYVRLTSIHVRYLGSETRDDSDTPSWILSTSFAPKRSGLHTQGLELYLAVASYPSEKSDGSHPGKLGRVGPKQWRAYCCAKVFRLLIHTASEADANRTSN